MTHDKSTHDRSTGDGTDPDRNGDRTESDEPPGDTDGTVDRRRFLQGTATSLATAGGLTAVGARASAGGSNKRLIVAGKGKGKHTYEIQMASGGTITKATHAGANDSLRSPGGGPPRVSGEVWAWNVDSYEYSGRIERVAGDGSLSLHFLDGAFEDDERIVVGGTGSGVHRYAIGTNSGDIEMVGATTEGPDSDDGDGRSERGYYGDAGSGKLRDDGVDVYTVGRGEPIQFVHVEDGHIAVDPYRPGRSLNTGASRTKTAVIVYSYMGDGPFTTLFQNYTNLVEPLRGYDKSVLLKHRNVSTPAYAKADEVRKPTRENFERTLRTLVDDGYTNDLFIMSHGIGDTDRNQHWERKADAFKMSDGTHGSKVWYTKGDIERLRASFGGDIPLRLVYQANCWGSNLNSAWRHLGATAAVGSRYVNFFPTQFADFAKWWRRGESVQVAQKRANTRVSRQRIRKLYIKNDIKATRGNWWGNEPATSSCPVIGVLDFKGQCAQDYLTNRWQHTDDEWNAHDLDGWSFMLKASEKLIAGDQNATR